VLSAGAIRSPQLLMLSGIGPEDQLQQFGGESSFDAAYPFTRSERLLQ
jgi:GMC oxidoreductase